MDTPATALAEFLADLLIAQTKHGDTEYSDVVTHINDPTVQPNVFECWDTSTDTTLIITVSEAERTLT